MGGANTYTGGTIIKGDKGILEVDRDTALGTGSLAVSGQNCTLRAGGTGDRTLANDVTLGHKFIINGNDLTLTGTVSLDNTLNVLRIENHTIISGVISDGSGLGAGSLDKQDSGTLTLSGLNTYTGATTVTSGSLNLGDTGGITGGGAINITGGTFNMVTGSVITPGTMNLSSGAFNQNGGRLDFTAFNQSGGTGTFTDLNLGRNPGDHSTYNLSGGSLNATYEYVGNAGTGSFSQSDGTNTVSGDLHVGDNTGTGLYNLSGGSLRVFATEYLGANGTFNHTGGINTVDTLDLSGGGAYNLRDVGVLAAANVMGNFSNSGTVNPGNSVGTMTVNGNYIQNADGTLMAEIASPASYDKLNATGAASLNGTLAPVLLGGYCPSGNQVFPDILNASGGVTGGFSSIADQQISPTLFWQTRYRVNRVDLVVQRHYANPGLGLNSNQSAVGTMLNGVAGVTSGDLNTVLNAIDSLPTAANVQEAYKQISPEKAGALANLGFVAASFQVRNLATRATNLRFVQGGSGGTSSLAPGGLSYNYSRQDGVMLAYNGGFLPDLFSARREFKAPGSRWGLFADAGAAFGTQSSTGNQTGYNFALGGLTLGADYRVTDKLLVGLATGYSNTASSFSGAGGSVTVNTIPFNAYAAYFCGSLYAYGSLGYALNLYNLKRCINIDGIGRTASSSTTGNQFNHYSEAGYDLKLSRMILTPAATLSYSTLWLDGFTENNAGALNLQVGPQNASSVQTGVGGRLTAPLKIGHALVVPQAYAFYQHEFANGSQSLNASLNQGSGTFTWQTEAAGRNYALVGVSLTAALRENLYALANFNAEVGRRHTTAQFINAGLRYEF